jgi:hypothetical protein
MKFGRMRVRVAAMMASVISATRRPSLNASTVWRNSWPGYTERGYSMFPNRIWRRLVCSA